MTRTPVRRVLFGGSLALISMLAGAVPSARALPPGQVVPGATTAGGGNVVTTNGNVIALGSRAWRVMPSRELGRFTLISVDLTTGVVHRVPFKLQPPTDSQTPPTRLDWTYALGAHGLYVLGTWCTPMGRTDRFSAPPDCSSDPAPRHTAQSFDLATGAERPWGGLGERGPAPADSRIGFAPYLVDATPIDAAQPAVHVYDIETGTPTPTALPNGKSFGVANGRALVLTLTSDLAEARSATVVEIATGRTLYTVDLARAARIGRGSLKAENVRLQQDGSLSLRLYPRFKNPDPRGLRPVAITGAGQIQPVGRTIEKATDLTTTWAPKRSIIGVAFSRCPRRNKMRFGGWVIDQHGTRARHLPHAYDTNTDTQWDGATLITGYGQRATIQRDLSLAPLSSNDLPSCGNAHL